MDLKYKNLQVKLTILSLLLLVSVPTVLPNLVHIGIYSSIFILAMVIAFELYRTSLNIYAVILILISIMYFPGVWLYFDTYSIELMDVSCAVFIFLLSSSLGNLNRSNL